MNGGNALETAERVKKVVSEHLGIDINSITCDVSFADDLGADSLDMAELVMGIEAEFDIEISENKADEMETIGDLTDYIKEQF